MSGSPIAEVENDEAFVQESYVRTALDLPDSELDPQEREFLGALRKHGWFNTRVFDPEEKEPDFSYSTGFFASAGVPEIIVFSLPKEVSHDILWDIFRDTLEGKVLPTETKIGGIFGNHEAVLLPVSKTAYREYLGWSRWFYQGDDFPCLQLLWPDRKGSFPWEDGFDPKFAGDQPDLTEDGWSKSVIK